MMVLMALSAIAVKQTKATTKTLGKCMQLLDYLASNSKAKVRFYVSDMIMNIYTQMHLTCWKPVRAAEHAGIFSWDGCQKMENP
jgi:hypothetical protein